MTDEPKKQITFEVINLETNEIEEWSMDEDDYKDMVECEKKHEEEREKLRKARSELEHRMMRYDKD